MQASSRYSNPNWLRGWQDFYQTSNDFWGNFGLNDSISTVWAQYVKNLNQTQQIVQDFNERWLEAAGLPTRDDIGRVGRQLYDIDNRLDTLEAELDAKSSENQKLRAEINLLQAEIARLQAQLQTKK